MKRVSPARLNVGDTVGLICPSRYVYGEGERVNKTINWLTNLGLKIKIGNNFYTRFYNSAGNKYQRAEDINNMFADTKVKAIWAGIGGDSANQILELLDFDLISNNPKILIGYSDVTNLLLSIYSKCNMMTFHGPNLVQFPELTKTSKKQLKKIFFGIESKFKINFSTIKNGLASGELVGGNLFIINNLIKTKYSPNYVGKILFWEEINEGLSSIEYQLYQLALSGVLKEISGMVMGHIAQTRRDGSRPLKQILDEITKNYNFPIIKMNCFGHQCKNFYTFPLGAQSEINTNKKEFIFQI